MNNEDTNPAEAVGSYGGFRIVLQDLINKECMESNSDTPDYILARYLTDCLEAYDKAVNRSRDWHYAENAKG